jgi:hypothetical protein
MHALECQRVQDEQVERAFEERRSSSQRPRTVWAFELPDRANMKNDYQR